MKNVNTVRAFKPGPLVAATNSGDAKLAIPARALGSCGLSIYNPDTTNKVRVYVRGANDNVPTVGGTDVKDRVNYSIAPESTWEFGCDSGVLVYLGTSAGTINLYPEDVF